MVLKIFVAGWIILLGALVINAIALKLNMTTWYEFTVLITKSGIAGAFQKTNVQSLLFLFVLYPLLLGILCYLSLRVLKL